MIDRLKKLTLLGLALAAFSQPTAAQEYLWPTDASRYLTSAFGESRPRRFHTGIDIKTWAKSGYKCFAVRDGYIARMRVSPNGYGKALYVRLDTGETAVYAHLSKFIPELEQIVWRNQQRQGKYRLDKYLTAREFPVTKGQLIAYTGETGIGVPHLHFEIRSPDNLPTNPLLKGYELKDHMPPNITRLAVIPFGPDSHADGDFRPRVYRTRFITPGKYGLGGPVFVGGEVGMAVSASDGAKGARNRYGVYRLELEVAGKVVYSVKYDRIPFNKNPMVDLDRDFALRRAGQGRFYRLFKDPLNTLRLYNPSQPWAGRLAGGSFRERIEPALDTTVQPGYFAGYAIYPERGNNGNQREASESATFDEGSIPFRVTVADFYGNESVLEGRLVFSEPGQVGDGSSFALGDPRRLWTLLDSLSIYLPERSKWSVLRTGARSWQPLSLDSRMISGMAAQEKPSYGRQLKNWAIIRLQGTDALGQKMQPLYLFERSRNDRPKDSLDVDLRFDYFQEHFRLELKTNLAIADWRDVAINGEAARMRGVDLTHALAALDYPDNYDDTLRVRGTLVDATGGAWTFHHDEPAFRVVAGSTRRLYSADSACGVRFNGGTLYRPYYGRIDPLEEVAATGRDRWKLASRPYRVWPQDAVLRKPAWVQIAYDTLEKNVRQLGVYYRNGRGKWVFIDNSIDTAHHTISAPVLSFEDFVLMRDPDPPWIGSVVPADGAVTRFVRPRIKAVVKDEQSGIASEESVLIRLDGRKLIAEYDPELHSFVYNLHKNLVPGTHQLIITAVDKVGNKARRVSNFTVVPK